MEDKPVRIPTQWGLLIIPWSEVQQWRKLPTKQQDRYLQLRLWGWDSLDAEIEVSEVECFS